MCRIAFVVALLVPLASSGCYPDPEVPIVAEGYEPDYYDGRVVYFNDAGQPYYYDDVGVAAFVPVTSPYYVQYVSHWRLAGASYRRWYAYHGYRYRTWRGYRGYYGAHGNVSAYHRR